MNEIIQKAIDGWYSTHSHFGDVAQYMPIYDENKLVLSDVFWQALGKECGWNRWDREYIYKSDLRNKQTKRIGWRTKALKFHEINLTEGWDKAIEYLQSIIKK